MSWAALPMRWPTTRPSWWTRDELLELKRRGLVRREADGTGYGWTVTEAGLRPWEERANAETTGQNGF